MTTPIYKHIITLLSKTSSQFIQNIPKVNITKINISKISTNTTTKKEYNQYNEDKPLYLNQFEEFRL